MLISRALTSPTLTSRVLTSPVPTLGGRSPLMRDDMPLFNTVLTGANFRRSNIGGADFRTSVGLTRRQVNSAISDDKTRLPDYLSGEQDQSQ